MKRFLVLILSILLSLGTLAGCSNGELKCIVHNFGENHLCVDNTCSVCGYIKKATASHNYGTWNTVMNAKCNSTGLKTQTCKDCGNENTVIIPKLDGHVYENGTCKFCGVPEGGSETATLNLFDMESDKLAIVGGDYEVKSSAGYTSSLDAVEVTATSNNMTVWYFNEEYAELPVGTLVGVNCRMKIKANGEIDYKDQTGYSQNIKLVNTQGIVVDYAYKLDFWNKVTVDAEIAQVDGKKGARFMINGAKNQTVTFSDFTTDNNVMILENLFGGVKVVQWQYPGALMQCYIITSPDGTNMIIDGGADGSQDQINGAKEALYQYLCENDLLEVDHWFITHLHGDHVGSLLKILNDSEKDLTIKKVYYDFPTEELCTQYGESYANVSAMQNAVANAKNSDDTKKIQTVITPKKTNEYKLDDYMTVRILNDAYFKSPTNMGNDSSIVFKLITPGADIAFLGDMGPYYGDILIKDQYFHDEISTCEVIQMGHHGQNGCTEYFYQQCDAMKICIYPGPSWVFDAGDSRGYGSLHSSGIHTMLTRSWVREIGIKYSYGGDSVLTIGK